MKNKKKTKRKAPGYDSLSYKPTAPRSKPDKVKNGPDWGIVAKSYLWMVEALQYAHDNTGLQKGAYSPELKEAIGQIKPLEKWRKNRDVKGS